MKDEDIKMPCTKGLLKDDGEVAKAIAAALLSALRHEAFDVFNRKAGRVQKAIDEALKSYARAAVRLNSQPQPISEGRRPFDLEAAKRGERVVTRDGREVAELHHFTTNTNSKWQICAVIDGSTLWFKADGSVSDHVSSGEDLFMAP